MPLSFNNETCSGCKVCLLVCALSNFKESCMTKALLNSYGKFPAPGKYYIDHCDQCGVCAEICPADAIREENGVYLIDKDPCFSCGYCVDGCPKKVMRMIDGFPHKCIDCGECADLCPRDALKFSSREEMQA